MKIFLHVFIILFLLILKPLIAIDPINYNQLQEVGLLGYGLSPIAVKGVNLYEIKDTNKVVAVKELYKERNWKNEVRGLYNIGKAPYTVGLIAVIEGKVASESQQERNAPVWLLMEPYLGGTLGDAVGHFTGRKFESDYESVLVIDYKNLPSLKNIDVVKFYIANLGLILDYIHNEAKWVWRDVKPANILLDSKTGYLVGVDFGISEKLSEASDPKKLIIEDWQQLGKRVLREGFRINKEMADFNEHPNDLKDLVDQLSAGQIVSLDDLKKHSFFNKFDWESMKNRTLIAPYLPPCRLIQCGNFEPYRKSNDEKVYFSDEYKEIVKAL